MSIIHGFRQWLASKRKTVLVPDGYKTVTVKPSSTPAINRAESGFWISDLGTQEHIEPGFRIVEENVIKEYPRSSVIWVLQKELLEFWAADALRIAVLLRRFHRVQSFRVAQGWAGKEMLSYWPLGPLKLSDLLRPHPAVQQCRIPDVAVVAEVGPNARALMTLLSSADIPTFTLGPENEVFVEVHTPDKIIIGMPGSKIAPPAEQTLRQLNLERDKIEKSPDATARLVEIEKRELAYIEKVVYAAVPPASKFVDIETGKMTTLLSDLMAQGAPNQDPKIYARCIEAFLRSKVGVRSSGGSEKAGGRLTSTAESPITFAVTTSGDGRERILVCADPPVYAMRFGEAFNFVIDGDEILKVVISIPECAGVYVNSALSEIGMPISRETAISVLKSRAAVGFSNNNGQR